MDKSEAQRRDRQLLNDLEAFYGKTLSELARRCGLATSTLTRPRNQPVKYRLSQDTLDKLREGLPEFFNRKDDEPFVGERSYVAVSVLPSYAGMGGGGTGDGDLETALISRQLVEDELRAKPADLLLIDVRGDSMEPDFKQGDQILVDKRDRDPAQPGPFALWDGDAYVVKLVERVPMQRGRYRVFSANSRYTGFEFDDDDDSIKIMGRPVWFARRL